MYYYKTTVRLGGSTMNEVVKIVSAPEFLVLQYVHGVDALTKVEVAKQEKTVISAEKQRLRDIYDVCLHKRDKLSIDKIFGPLGSLPNELPEELLEKYDLVEDDLVGLEAQVEIEKISKKVAKKSNLTHTAKNDKQVENENRIVPAEEVNVENLME